jgi:lipoprotein NlpD
MDAAPVTDVNMIEPVPKNGIYHVAAGETLYSIAWRYGVDYRELAQRNHLTRPYTVKAGQLIYLTSSSPTPKTKSITPQFLNSTPPAIVVSTHPANKHASVTPPDQEPHHSISFWGWPAQGRIVDAFSSINKGINIAGYVGSPIFAAAAGKIVYSGHGLRGYGNLIIIKHNSKFLSAYAHNKKILVKEGDWVTNGQKIAEMGNTGAHRTLLHFEIRRNGQPVNPLIYLTHKV